MAGSVPSFLEETNTCAAGVRVPVSASYTHNEDLGNSKAYCQWWPCRTLGAHPSTILLFLPGNPGLIGFYNPFLMHIYHSSAETLAILGCSLLGHSPHVDAVPAVFYGLHAQVQATIAVIDSIRLTFGPSAKLVLIGHSVGSWIVMQALKQRSSQITGVFLLFPTVANIACTPNGRRLSWLFYPPLPRFVSIISRLLSFLPSRTLSLLFGDWPLDQLQVLWSFLRTPSAIMASLSLAHQEMLTIRDLDTTLLDEVKHRLFFYFAENDDWVGENKDLILHEITEGSDSVRVVHGRRGLPHAYCINHGDEIAKQCLQWLGDAVFD